MWQIVSTFSDAIIDGLLVTLKLAAIAWASGIVIGGALGVFAARVSFVGVISRSVSFVLAAMPVLVFLFWMHYPLQEMLGIVVEPFNTAALTLSIINIFLVSELVRGAVKEFPRQYDWAAMVCGLSERECFFKIRLPILLRQILPSLLLIEITMLQATLFASLISVDEIFRVAQHINSLTYKPVEIYSLLAIFFIIICLPVHLLATHLKKKYTRNLSER